MMTVVLDVNVWVSALIAPSGTPGKLIAALGDAAVEVAFTKYLWRDLERVVHAKIKPFLEKRGRWDDARDLMADYREVIRFVQSVRPRAKWVPDDPADDWVVQCARTARADYIVSGDKHLLDLGAPGGVKVVRPAQALAVLQPTRPKPLGVAEPRPRRYGQP